MSGSVAPLRAAWSLARRDLLEFLRDRRTVVVTLLLLSLELMLVPVPVLLVLTMWASLMKFVGPQEGR